MLKVRGKDDTILFVTIHGENDNVCAWLVYALAEAGILGHGMDTHLEIIHSRGR